MVWRRKCPRVKTVAITKLEKQSTGNVKSVRKSCFIVDCLLTNCGFAVCHRVVFEREYDRQTPVRRGQHVSKDQQVPVEDKEVHHVDGQHVGEDEPVQDEDDAVDADEGAEERVEEAEALNQMSRLALLGLEGDRVHDAGDGDEGEDVGGIEEIEKVPLFLYKVLRQHGRAELRRRKAKRSLFIPPREKCERRDATRAFVTKISNKKTWKRCNKCDPFEFFVLSEKEI